jgi:hypothetical protein
MLGVAAWGVRWNAGVAAGMRGRAPVTAPVTRAELECGGQNYQVRTEQVHQPEQSAACVHDMWGHHLARAGIECCMCA